LTTRVYTLVSTLHQLPPLPDSIEIEAKEGSDERECIKLTNVSVRVPSSKRSQTIFPCQCSANLCTR
jgi:ATP-binding cassette, subfamily D (ALD), peroxisomal long-chain fatty acid import protein